MSALFSDFFRSWRGSLRQPGFLVLATFTLALGVAASISVLHLVDRVLLRPLPYPQPGQLFAAGLLQQGGWNSITPQEYQQLQALPGVAAMGLASMGPVPVNLADPDRPELVQALVADAGFLRTLAPVLALGRNFDSSEDAPNAAPAVIISHGLWQRRFKGAADVIGRSLAVEGRPTPVVGVLPADFRYAEPFDLILPLGLPGNNRDNGRNFLAIVRLADDAAADAISGRINQRIRDLYVGTRAGEAYRQSRFGLSPLSSALTVQARPVLVLFLASAACVLLLALINLANLLLLRALGRRHLLSVRRALGATRARLFLPLLAEGSLIGLLATVLGLALAWAALRLGAGLVPPAWFGGAMDLSPDLRTVGMALAAGLLSAQLAAVFAAWRAQAGELVRELAAGGRSSLGQGSRRLARAGVVGQVALASVLLLAAGLFARNLQQAGQVDLGYRSEGLVAFELSPVQALYPDPASVRQLVQAIVERLETVPGLEQAGAGTNLPIGAPLNYPVALAGQELASVELRAVTAGLLEAFEIPLLAGRRFDGRERAGGAPVMLVNRVFVTTHMGLDNADPSALSQALERIVQMPAGEEMAQFRIIGVVGDTRQHGPEHAPPAMVYLPFAQLPDSLLQLLRDFVPLRFAVRSQAGTAPMLAAIADAVGEVAPGQPLANLRPVSELVHASTGATRLNLRLVGAFAGLALLLAAVGLYAVVAVTVAARRREFGIRRAMGASRPGLLRRIMADGLRQVLAGLALGTVAAFALSRWLQAQVAGLAGPDPVVLLAVAVVLVATALLACLAPALRALRLPPALILRAE